MKAKEIVQVVEGWLCEERSHFSCYERSQAKAMLHWLKRYRPKASANNLQRVKGWLEGVHYLTSLENYRLAYKVMQVQLGITASDDRPLHELLGRWGYNAERLTLYESLLEKLSVEDEVTLIDGIAHTHHSLGDYDEVLWWCDRYREALTQLTDPLAAQKAEGRLYGLIGITHHAKGDYLQAVDAQEQRLAIRREAADCRGQADALGDLGIARFSMGEFAVAIACHEEQLELALLAKDEEQQMMALGSLAHVALALGQTEVAKERYEKLDRLAQQRSDRIAECGALTGLGNISRVEGRLDDAVVSYRRSAEIAREVGHRRGETVALSSLAVALNAAGEYSAAGSAAERALGLAQILGSDSLQGQALQVLGMVASSLQDYEAAISVWVEAVALFEQMGDKPNLGLALFNLGGVMAVLGEANDAVGCWLRSLLLFSEIENRARMQTVVSALCGHLEHEIDASFFEQPVTVKRLRKVWKEAIFTLEKDYGEERVNQLLKNTFL